MKTAIAAIALVYLTSFVIADHHTVNKMSATDANNTTHNNSNSSLFEPVGVIDNKLVAKNKTILVTDSNIVISLSDRAQLARIIKNILPSAVEAHQASTMIIDDIYKLLTRITTTPGGSGILLAAKSGNTAALARQVVSFLQAAVPATPVVAATVSQGSAITPVDTSAKSVDPMKMNMRSPMLSPFAAAASIST